MKKLILSTLLGTAITAPAHAQDAPPAPSPSAGDNSDEIVIADMRRDDHQIIVLGVGATQRRNTNGQSVSILLRDDIDRAQIPNVSDLLATTAGVTVTRNGGPGGYAAVRIRGAEDSQTLVLIDGVRMGDPSTPGGGFDFGNLPSSGIERIEVLRGANSVALGSQALGGVVDIVTGDGNYYGHQANTAIDYGRYDTLSTSAGFSANGQHLKLSASGYYGKSDGYSVFARGTEPDGYRRYGGYVRANYSLSRNVEIDLRGRYADTRADLDGYDPVTFAFTDTPEYSKARETSGYAGLTLRLFDQRFTNRISASLSDIDRDNFNPDPTRISPLSFSASGRDWRYAYQGDFAFTDQLRAVFGAETERSRIRTLDKSYEPFPSSLGARTHAESVYGQLIFEPVTALTFTGGARYDHHRDFGGATSFGANAVWRIGYGSAIRASFGEGFKAPTLFQLYSSFGDPTLRPERARSMDVGIEKQFMNERIHAGITLFHRRTRNQIDFNLASYTYGNIARTRAQGVELTLDLRPARWLTFGANYSLIDTENRSSGSNFGKQLARRPRHNLNLAADFKPNDDIDLGATIQLVGDSFDDAGNFRRIDGHAISGLRGSWTISNRFTLYGRIENMFDVRYQTISDYGTARRSATVGLRASF